MNRQSSPRALYPVVLAISLTVVFLAALGYLAHVRNRERSRAVPALIILEPQRGSVVDSPLLVRFQASDTLRLVTGGWGVDNLHLHARINGIDYMPAANDLRALATLQYEWQLSLVPRGPVRLQLGWADRAHRELANGATDTYVFTLK